MWDVIERGQDSTCSKAIADPWLPGLCASTTRAVLQPQEQQQCSAQISDWRRLDCALRTGELFVAMLA